MIHILKYINRASGKALVYEDKDHAHIVGNYYYYYPLQSTDKRSTFGIVYSLVAKFGIGILEE